MNYCLFVSLFMNNFYSRWKAQQHLSPGIAGVNPASERGAGTAAQHRAGSPFVVVFLWKVKIFSVETQFSERQMLKLVL